MATMSTSMTVPCTADRAVLAVQDVLNQVGWPVLEVTSEQIVAQGPGQNALHLYNFPRVTVTISDRGSETDIGVTVSHVGPMLSLKKHFAGIMGRFTNALSLRVQTESIAINPTVALGQGQGQDSGAVLGGQSRAQQLRELKELLDLGVLTPEEFEKEKARVLES